MKKNFFSTIFGYLKKDFDSRVFCNIRTGIVFSTLLFTVGKVAHSVELNISTVPLFLGAEAPPLNMLVLGRDHKLFYEAYNDASDLNGDGQLDIGYKPDEINYFGYFDSFLCYTHSNNLDSGLFRPVARAPQKTCSGTNQWSGDFLNYITTSRIDALRKVFYGGLRAVDTESETILERSYIPQDAHSWGKEYTDVATDGYDIRDYTPLQLPQPGTRHLFANTTFLNDSNQYPRMRVLTNSGFRIWEWVSIERPVAGARCLHGGSGPLCEVVGAEEFPEWEVVPSSAFSNLTQTTYDTRGSSIRYPRNRSEYEDFVRDFAISSKRYGSRNISQINGSRNPFGSDEEYLTIFEGQLTVPADGVYQFAVDGDDALVFFINGQEVTAWYNGHGRCNCTRYSGSIQLQAGVTYNIQYWHQEYRGGDNYTLHWKPPAASKMTDYGVKVEVCNNNFLSDDCRVYPSGNAKPIGVLQDFGENESMMFGLISGSYSKNTSGGVLRKNVSPLTDEIDPQTGQFTSLNGIIKTLDKLTITGFGGAYLHDCGFVWTRPIREGECAIWGNPIAEMMYETLRYFDGKATPTSAFVVPSNSIDSNLGLNQATWQDPYEAFPTCSKPFQTVISDINPSYDSDQIPGTAFSGTFSTDLAGFNASSLASTITANEPNVTGLKFIGQSGGLFDSAPTPKNVTSLGNIRGLAPEEPTKQGSYYSASAAYFGKSNSINPKAKQTLDTFTIALASPLPQIEINVGNNTITLVPFAKSVGGGGISTSPTAFQPTNQIVDFYLFDVTPTSGFFQINFEDIEQGGDHDLDAIVEYRYQVNNDGTVTINLESTYAAGGIQQHMGYIISGTTNDGIYLEVRDRDTSEASARDYFLDTPPGVWANDHVSTRDDGLPLPLSATRTFTPSLSGDGAGLLQDPLWFAAKWGGFIDENEDNIPQKAEWDADDDGVPDNYFLVTNALNLKQRLESSFTEIIDRQASASSVSIDTSSLSDDTRIYQARFSSGFWSGELLSYELNDQGDIGDLVWEASAILDQQNWDTGRTIFTFNRESVRGVAFRWPQNINSNSPNDIPGALITSLNLDPLDNEFDGLGSERLSYLRGLNDPRFRNRKSLLGDIINSTPVVVGPAKRFYTFDNYETFKQLTANRPTMIYAGSNDGMLHGFDAETGEEKLAYVPSAVHSKLGQLSNSDYKHHYYVDGHITVGDVFNGRDWSSLLVGGLRAGGQGYFALDITDPTKFDENIPSRTVKWEFNDTDDSDLGYTFGEASIVKMKNDRWAVVFGNGYNNMEADGNASSTGNAVLFIVDALTGELIKKLDTQSGIRSPENNGKANGLSTPSAVDIDSDGLVDVIYAGDLYGNLWRFDVNAESPAFWKVGLESSGKPVPLFRAISKEGDRQPIVSQPEIGRNTERGGLMIYFGTGKYFEVNDQDVENQPTQTFYGIWDRGLPIDNILRQHLLKQEIFEELQQTFSMPDGNSQTFDLRLTTDNVINWYEGSGAPSSNLEHLGWYLDLVNVESGNSNNFGERQVSNSILRDGKIIFTTLLPSSDPCDFGGTSWLMELNAMGGARLPFSPIDLNGDGIFDENDRVETVIDGETVTIPISGVQSLVGIISEPGILNDCGADGGECKYTSGSTGELQKFVEKSDPHAIGRQSWIEIKQGAK